MKYLTLKWLIDKGACLEGRDFFIEQWGVRGKPDLEEVFVTCLELQHPEHMDWLFGRGLFNEYPYELLHCWFDESDRGWEFDCIYENHLGRLCLNYAEYYNRKLRCITLLPSWAQKEVRKFVKENCK